MRCLPKVFFITLLLAIAPSGVTWAFEEDEGVLDRPIPQENPANVVSSPVVVCRRGAPSLNRAGVKFYPIRAQRTQ